METRTVTQEVFLNATPQEVFEAFLDEKQHAAFTGLPATIERKPGGKFTACGEHLSGTTFQIAPVHKIAQNWRAYQWPAGHYSELSLTLQPISSGQGTQLSLVQAGVPAEHYENINTGWRNYYWSKLGPYLRERKVAVAPGLDGQRV